MITPHLHGRHLQKALEEAKAAAADNTVTQEAADLARTNLLKAANALVKKR